MSESRVAAVELSLFSVKECFIFKVPPLKSASGHRAEDWGIDKPLMTGHLKVFQTDDKLRIVLYRYKDPESSSSSDENLINFAECPIAVKPKEDITPYVDAVIDSSRYYVLRIKDPSHPTRSAIIGIGFRERDVALDFKHVLNEYVRFVDRMAQADQLAAQYSEEDETTGDGDASNVTRSIKDMSLKEGQKIHINVKHRDTGPVEQKKPRGGGLGGLMPPPPPPSAVAEEGVIAVSGDVTATAATSTATTAAGTTDTPIDANMVEDEDWGDFA